MLSRDGLALSPGLFPRSVLCLPTCFLLSPHLFPHALAGLDAVMRWSGSVNSLSLHLFPFVSPLVSSRACWAGCYHEMVWLGQLFVSHLIPFLSPLVFSLACWAGCCLEMVSLGQLFVSPLVCLCLPTCFLLRLLGWMLSRDGLARSALCFPPLVSFCLPACFLTRLSPHLFTFVSPLVFSLACWAGCCHEMAWPGQPFVSPLAFVSPLVSSRACWAGCCHELVWLGQLFVSPLVSGCCHEMVWLGQRFVSPLVSICPPTFCWAGCCHEMVWLGQLFFSPLARMCLPTCFLTRLLGWMLSRDGLSALCLPACFLVSPHLDAVTRWSVLVSSLSPRLFPFVSPLCWAGCCHEMVWLGQLFVSPLVSFCVPTCFLTRLLAWMLSRDGLARSALCLPTCFLTRLARHLFVSPFVSLSPHLFPHALAGLDAVIRWSGSVSSLFPRLFPFVSLLDAVTRWSGSVSSLFPPACFLTGLLGWMLSQDGLARLALCFPLVCHLFPHALAGLDAVTRWSGSFSSLSSRLFACVSPLVSLRACWAGCCHEMVWLGQLFVSLFTPHLFPHVLAGLGWLGQLFVSPGQFSRGSSLSPHLFAFLPTCFLLRSLGWMLSRDGLARSALCFPACFLLSPRLFPHALAGLDTVTRFSGSVSSLSPHLFPVSPLVS